MVLQVLSPGVQDAEQSDIGAQVLRVASHFQQRCGTDAEEQIVQQPLVLQHERGEFMWQREYDVEVGHGQELGGSRGQPLGASVALALGAVPVATRVIRDGLIPAAKTLIAMASQGRSAATDDGLHDLAVLPGQVRSLPFPEATARCAEDVGHFKGGPSHLFTRLLDCLTASGLDTSIASNGLATACKWRRDKWRYTVVSASLACPSRSWMVRRSAPASSR